ncbi:MAG: hypothetical protein FD146_2394 [Anaerolineaceae bacterium]|nr:MAG: hypothetical protein FD146_2394 [Anaerolineaceae bacterium]
MDTLPFAYITLYPLVFWLGGLVVGGGLGWAVALLCRAIYRAWPAGRSVLMLAPWRAVIFALLWVLWSPFFYFMLRIRELPRATYDFMQIGTSLLLLAFILAIAVLVRHWFPSTLAVRLVSEARTLAVAAVMVATLGIATSASENFVFVIRVAVASTFDTALIWQGWMFVFLAMLAFDLLPGILQTVLAFVTSRKKSAVPA